MQDDPVDVSSLGVKLEYERLNFDALRRLTELPGAPSTEDPCIFYSSCTPARDQGRNDPEEAVTGAPASAEIWPSPPVIAGRFVFGPYKRWG